MHDSHSARFSQLRVNLWAQHDKCNGLNLQKQQHYQELRSLTYSKIEQANPYASSKQHGEICSVVEFRFFVRFAQLQLGILGQIQHNNEQGPHVLSANIQPSECCSDPFSPLGHLFVCRFSFQDTPRDKTPYNDGRKKRYNRVEANVECIVAAAGNPETKPATFLRCFFLSVHSVDVLSGLN